MNYLHRIFNQSKRTITQNDIGIISPYRRQCEQLTEQCARNGYPGIQIGSVEIFQGQEKPIIIVSTVRSQMDSIGFLNSKKVGIRQLNSKYVKFVLNSVFCHCFFFILALKCFTDTSKMLVNYYW